MSSNSTHSTRPVLPQEGHRSAAADADIVVRSIVRRSEMGRWMDGWIAREAMGVVLMKMDGGRRQGLLEIWNPTPVGNSGVRVRYVLGLSRESTR